MPPLITAVKWISHLSTPLKRTLAVTRTNNRDYHVSRRGNLVPPLSSDRQELQRRGGLLTSAMMAA